MPGQPAGRSMIDVSRSRSCTVVEPSRSAVNMSASFASRADAAATTSSVDPPGTITTPSRSPDHPVARPDLDVADHGLDPDRADVVLRRAAQHDAGREHREPVCLQRVHVANPAIDDETLEPAGLGSGGQHLAPEPPIAVALDLDAEHGPGRSLGHRGVDRQVVDRPAHDGIGGPDQPGSRPHRSDPRRHAVRAGFAQRRGPEPLQGRPPAPTRRSCRHSPPTSRRTCRRPMPSSRYRRASCPNFGPCPNPTSCPARRRGRRRADRTVPSSSMASPATRSRCAAWPRRSPSGLRGRAASCSRATAPRSTT